MTAPHDLDRQLTAFLEDGPTELPEPSFYAVRDDIEETRQWVYIGPWRLPDMNKLVPLGLGTAAVVVALVVGGQVLRAPAPSGVGAAPSSAPSATASPTPKPSIATPSPSADGSLPKSQFVLTWPGGGGPRITVDRPASWAGDPSGGVLVGKNGGDPPDGAAIIGPFFGDLYVYGNPCHWSTTLPRTPATTVDEAVAALSAQALRGALSPVDITVDGHAGKSITLHVPDDTLDSACDGGKFASWAGGGDPDTSGPSRYHQGPGQIDEVWVLDVDGELVVVDGMYGAQTSAGLLDELHAILQSMTFK